MTYEATDRAFINQDELEGHFVKLTHGENVYQCTGGFGCSPKTGGKIFLLDVQTGTDAGHCRREDIRAIVTGPSFIPNGISTFMTTRSDDKPGCVGLNVQGLSEPVWVHESQLGDLAQFFLKLALKRV